MTTAATQNQRQIYFQKSRVTLFKFLIIVFPMWLSAKMYNGPYVEFVRNYLTAIILIILLSLLFQLIFTKAGEKAVLVGVFVLLSLIQISYSFMPSLYAGLGFSIGTATFFKGEFSVHLIPYYGVGGFIGFFVLRQCISREQQK